MKTLWVVSGGVEAVPGIQRAKEMGLHVVVSDGDPNAPGFSLADDCIIASTYDAEGTAKQALDYDKNVRPVDGVICIASDVPSTVATVAQVLGLPGIPVESARLATDKLAMKERLATAGIPVPWFRPVGSVDELRTVVEERGFPLVIKPVDSRGARGVLRLTEDVDLEWALEHACECSPTSRVMIEEFVAGPQVSTESALFSDGACTPGFSDRNYEYLDRFAPYVIENGGEQPSALQKRERRAVARLAERAARALGVTFGTAKGDMVLSDEGPKVIEIAARLSGGWFCTNQIPLATGVDLVGAAIRFALGESVDEHELAPRELQGVAIRYFFPEPGRVTGITNADQFLRLPWVHELRFFVSPGENVEPATNHTRRAGFVITTGPTREKAVARARHVIETVRIETVRDDAPPAVHRFPPQSGLLLD